MLTELQVKTAKPKEKYYMFRDDRGLYLRVDTSGKKYWILGYTETAQRVKVIIGQVFRYAIAAGYAENDPTTALQGSLETRRPKADLTKPSDIEMLMKNINVYPHAVVRCALNFSALIFLQTRRKLTRRMGRD